MSKRTLDESFEESKEYLQSTGWLSWLKWNWKMMRLWWGS